MSATPFKVHVPESKITQLKQKLAAANFPDEQESAGWDLGAPLADIKRLAKYWHEEFDWRQAETELNQLPQFVASVQIEDFDPIDLHFVHAKSPNPNAIPLIFCHGWPGSFDEASRIIPLLLDGGPDHPSFHVIAPSMPNYGFSSRVRAKGFGVPETATVFNKLMVDVLGYKQYVSQGGDWGYIVSRYLGYLFPEHCRASHYNAAMPKEPSETHFPEVHKKDQETPQTESERLAMQRSQWFLKEGMGYRMLQATKPQTLAYSLVDSPVGLLAWIYEKLHDWTDSYPFTDYEVCKWVSLYWFSRPGPAAGSLLYYAHQHPRNTEEIQVSSMYLKGVKIGISQFCKDISNRPLLWNLTLGDVVLNKAQSSGGHFPAFERPKELVDDVREMFGKNGGAYGVVDGRTGFA